MAVTWAEVHAPADDSAWVRTDVWVGTRTLRLLPDTYWFVLGAPDRATRVAVDARTDAVRWQYPATRILRARGVPTRHLAAFLED